ncbi:isochorismate synthase [Actinocorallia longicatena]|uniref:isochorismate synthase n=1 Tax=Actinocorallia longicatena TaxID=111803 RepID=A0ABP6PV21_9ACTN
MSVALGASERLVVRTVPVAGPVDLIGRLPHPSALAWIRGDEGLVGWGEAVRIAVPGGDDRFAWAGRRLEAIFAAAEVHDPLRVPGSGPVAFGAFGFDAKSSDSVLIVPRTVLGWRDGRAWLTTIGEPEALTLVRPLVEPEGIGWTDGTLSAPEWGSAVGAAVERIREGRLGKVVLARDLWAESRQPLDARVLLRRLSDRFPACYTFAVDGLVGATPELLVRRSEETIESLVLAGTTPRGRDAAEDEVLADRLLHSRKDLDEHAYAATMVREALTPLCDSLDLPDSPELLRLANLQHLATPVRGRLNSERSVLDVLAALHPTPAVGGTPTDVALDLIRELEVMDRARYAGPVGWVDARGDGEWGIALRCAQLEGNRARLFAGCGIVAESVPEAELAETQTKFRAMREALEG